jgi:hypothetical protein
MKSAVVLVLSLPLFTLTTAVRPLSAQNPGAVVSTERKLDHVESKAKLIHPDPKPTEFTEQEINAYLASGAVQFPAGVQSARFQEQPGVVTANTRVDFDRLRAGINSSNPLLSVFTGVHDVIVVAHAYGLRGKGFVHVDSVSLDGVEIPRFVLQLFVDKYLRPKYPQAGLDSQFVLPDKIDSAGLGSHTLTVTQR